MSETSPEQLLTEKRLELLPRGAECACGIRVFSAEDRLTHAGAHMPPVELEAAAVDESAPIPPADPPVIVPPVDPERDPNTGTVVE